nr:MAG TPA: hypothetical protein [Caudoviricetes sp.]
MLIRSQDKTAIINVDNAFNIAVRDINGTIVIHIGNSSSCCIIAEYSTKAKAMKVLDMFQESYANFETVKITSTGWATAAYAGSYDTPESVSAGIEILRGYAEILQKAVVFQMPEDSEVEI